MHLDHLTEHRLREAELVRRVEQARHDRERLAARPGVAPVARTPWFRLPRLSRLAVRGRRPA